MSYQKPSAPSHLAIFVTDPRTGRPVERLPLYAEVAVPRIVPIPPVSGRFDEPLRAALFDIDPTATGAVRARVETAAREAFGLVIDESSREAFCPRISAASSRRRPPSRSSS